MCLYPRIIPNKRYEPNISNGGFPPEAKDKRLTCISAGCGKCIECRKQKAREWQVRLNEEIRDDDRGLFMTMTFSDEALEKFKEEDPNEVATKAIELFRKRWYKKYKEGIKHWLVTELGHDNTERLHLHGILWTDKTCEEIEKVWQYGWVDTGKYVNEQSVGYITKYVSKADEKHPEYISKTFATKGLGRGFLSRYEAKHNAYKGRDTQRYYKTPKGFKIALPLYYQNKLWTDEQKEELRLQKLDEKIVYVRGERIDISTIDGLREYGDALEYHQRISERLGYTKNPWSKKTHKKARKYLDNQKK